MFSKPIVHDKSEAQPELKNYLYRYKLNNMLDDKKTSFEEFMKLSIKDNLTEAEAKRFIGYLAAKKKAKLALDPQQEEYKYRFQLESLMSEHKITFEEFIQRNNKDNSTEAEAKVYVECFLAQLEKEKAQIFSPRK